MTRKILSDQHSTLPRPSRSGFTLVEVLVVIGIIGILISILLPALSKAKEQANCLECKAHLHEVGLELQLYSDHYEGWIIPVGDWIPDAAPPANPSKGHWDTLGTEMPLNPTTPWDGARQPRPLDQRWPFIVWGEKYPKVLHCPDDPQTEPLPKPYESFHSYLLNKHLAVSPITLFKGSTQSPARSDSEIIVMGEKVWNCHDYYMEGTIDNTKTSNEYQTTVELQRHGSHYGSNYLYKDWHVDNLLPSQILGTEDPWDVTQVGDMVNTEGDPPPGP